MPGIRQYFVVVLVGIALAGLVLGGASISCDGTGTIGKTAGVEPTPVDNPALLAQPTVTPISTMQPKTTSGPVSVQNSGTSDSVNMRDLTTPRDSKSKSESEPVEINKQNRTSIRKINPDIVPSKDGALSNSTPKGKRLVKKKKP